MDFTTGSFVLVGAALLIVILACYARGKDYLQFSNLINPILTSLSAVLHAQEHIERMLAALSIDITPEIQSVIQGAIALTCYLMPHHSKTEEA